MKSHPLLAAIGLISVTVLLSSQQPPRNIGKQACWSCHQPQQKMVSGTPHENGTSCEGCHGPGEAHVKSGGRPDTIFSYKRASAAEIRDKCGQCHNLPVMGRHASGDVSCISCHSSHHYTRKKYLLRPQDTMDHPA